jgi:hypothetical protein
VTVVSEGQLKPQDFVDQFKVDPPDPVIPLRKAVSGPPPGLATVNLADCVDVQDNFAHLFREGEFSETRPDALASDGVAVWMPSTHREWAYSVRFNEMPNKARTGKWKVYAVVRVDKDAGTAGTVFTAGVYDEKSRSEAAQLRVEANDADAGYKAYLIGTVDATADRYVWVAPAETKGAKAVWVDRIYLVPAK